MRVLVLGASTGVSGFLADKIVDRKEGILASVTRKYLADRGSPKYKKELTRDGQEYTF